MIQYQNNELVSNSPKFSELLQLKKAIKISEAKLANELNINRPLLNQFFKGKRKITYDKFLKIYDYLYKQKNKNKKPLYKICSKNITYVKSTDSLKKVKELMAKEKFDAVPVNEKGKVIGKVNSFYVGTRVYPQDSKIKVKEIMEESPIIVPYNTKTELVENFLSSIGDLVILTKQGADYGIVDPWDRVNKA